MKKVLAISVISLMSFILFPSAASAHAGIVSTTPSQDQVLTAMPQELSITFTEDLLTIDGKAVNTISLTHFDGPPVEIGEVSVQGARISAAIPESEYESGVYEVTYSIVSADGHKVTDSYTFSLNAPTLYVAPAAKEPSKGVIPTPIVGAIIVVIVIGGIYLIARRK
jgi:hypothetical protein